MSQQPKTHKLKCVNPEFQLVKNGLKTFELRRDDRNFKVNDYLELCEYNTRTQELTGDSVVVLVTYILFCFIGLENGYVIMSIKII